jgi:hypothetical protein
MSTLSLNAYREQVQSGKDLPKVYHVYKVIENGPGYNLECFRNLGLLPYPHQTLTSAISRLMDSGMVYQSDAGDFYPVPAGYEERYRENRRQDRFRKWINLGRREGFFDDWMREELARG